MKKSIFRHGSRQVGFTLIELLVVIAIIGLLSTLAVVSLNNARMKTRDAKRVSDINHIQTALELYYSDANAYPATVNTGGAGSISFGSEIYMAVVPSNPVPENDGNCAAGSIYTYTSASPFTTYTLSYCLGGQTGDISEGIHTASPGTIR